MTVTVTIGLAILECERVKLGGFVKNFGGSSGFNLQVKKLFKLYGATFKNIYKHFTTSSNIESHKSCFVKTRTVNGNFCSCG
jgi:hypothetical protein